MGFWIVAALIGTQILGALFKPRPRKSLSRPASPGEFGYPDSTDGVPIPVLFGTQQIREPRLAWIGDKSTTPIVDGGSVVGYKYFAGAMFVLCLGPIDALVDILFNDKHLGQAIDASRDGIVFGAVPPTYHTAHVPAGSYSDGASVARAAETAMKAAEPGNWKVAHTFVVEANRTDELQFTVYHDDETTTYVSNAKAHLTPGVYTGAALATEIARALWAATPESLVLLQGGSGTPWTVAYDGVTHKFKITLGSEGTAVVGHWILGNSVVGGGCGCDYSRTAMTMLGYHLERGGYVDWARVDLAVGIQGDIGVVPNRFIIAQAGTDLSPTLKLTDAGFTIATILGYSTAANVTCGAIVAMSGTDFTGITTTFTDHGDFIQCDVADNLAFGPDGGVSGRLDVYKGLPGQAACDYLVTQWGAASAFPGLCYAVLRGMYVGNTNYPKPPSFVLRRLPNPLALGGGVEDVAADANPAEILYEALSDSRWGMGISPAKLDSVSFSAAATTLKGEGLGVSMLWDAVKQSSDVIEDILRHADGILYQDGHTALVSAALARGGYDLSALPVADSSNSSLAEFSRPSWQSLVNSIRIRYVDRLAGFAEEITEPIQDLGRIQAAGGVQVMEELEFLGFSTTAAAQAAGYRALRALGYPLARLTLDVDREFWTLSPGSVFRYSRSEPELAWMNGPYRITSLTPPALSAGRVRIEAVEDIFGAS